MKYYQCRLEQQTNDGIITTVGWIEERGAKPGYMVELKGKDGLWLVKSTGGKAINSEALKAKQNMDRGSLPSIKGNS